MSLSSRRLERIGATSLAIAWICSLVSAPVRVLKTPDTLIISIPVASSAARVFSKVGGSGFCAIASTSARCSAIALSKAGRKCSSWISSNGATPNGVVHSVKNGFSPGASPPPWPPQLESTTTTQIASNITFRLMKNPPWELVPATAGSTTGRGAQRRDHNITSRPDISFSVA